MSSDCSTHLSVSSWFEEEGEAADYDEYEEPAEQVDPELGARRARAGNELSEALRPVVRHVISLGGFRGDSIFRPLGAGT